MERAGGSLIETMRVREGCIPLLDRHLARLGHSLAALGLPKPSQDVAALVAPFAECGEAVLRVEVAGGRASVTVRDLPRLDPPTVITAAVAHRAYPHKTTERGCFDAAGGEAAAAGADDALLLTVDGWVAEGTVWNLFWWDEDFLHTPVVELGILPGIGRGRVLEVWSQMGPRAREGQHARNALLGKSLFLTNAVRGVVPIAALDGKVVPSDPRTTELFARFWPAG